MGSDLAGLLRASLLIRNLNFEYVKDLQKEKQNMFLHLCRETDLKLSYDIGRLEKRDFFFRQPNKLG